MPTTTEADLREMVAKGMQAPQIAAKLERSVTNVRAALSVLGISTGHRGRPKGDGARIVHDTAAYLSALRKGQTLTQIAAERGFSRAVVYQHLKRAGLPTTPAGHTNAKRATPAAR